MVDILDWDALTPRQRAQAVAIDWSDGDPPSVLDRLSSYRTHGRRYRGYEALFAVDHGIPAGKVGSIRLTWRTARRSQVVCGIADVVTRPDATRRGVATRLLEESHRRARAEGIRWSFLWTRRSWGAHRAYERLGYRDVYSARVAVRKVPSLGRPSPLPSGYTARPARRRDADLLESILAEATAHRIGFVPREPGSFVTRFRLGWRKPGDHRILSYRGRPVGYAHVAIDRHDALCREFVVTRPSATAALLRHVEAIATGRWLGFGSTRFTRNDLPLLRRRGFEFVELSHPVLMACPLDRATRVEWEEIGRTVASPRFFLELGDSF